MSLLFSSFSLVCIKLPQNKLKLPIKPILTGLQKDTSICRFWTVFLVLVSLLKIPFHSPTLVTIPIHHVKSYLKELWIVFLSDPGVDAYILKCICLDLGHTEDPACKILLASGHIVSNIILFSCNYQGWIVLSGCEMATWHGIIMGS